MIYATDHSTRHGRFKPPSFESLWDSSVDPSTVRGVHSGDDQNHATGCHLLSDRVAQFGNGSLGVKRPVAGNRVVLELKVTAIFQESHQSGVLVRVGPGMTDKEVKSTHWVPLLSIRRVGVKATVERSPWCAGAR